MKDTSVHRPPTARQRRSIAIVTAAFILLSAGLHFVLGGIIRQPWAHQPVQQPARLVTLERMPTPPPTPKPTPRPTLRPAARPVRAPAARLHKTQPFKAIVIAPVRVRPPKIQGLAAGTQPPLAPQQPDAPQIEASPTPMDARDIIVTARFIKQVQPEYPQEAIDAGAQGTVVILVTIGPDGSASDIRVSQSSGSAALDRAALEAAKESTFAPPEVDGQPATQTYRIIYTFYLD
jgi:protein TonB